MRKDSNTLYYNKPAKMWTSALPLGNGKIGAMIYGCPQVERISINHDELWSGYPKTYQHMCSNKRFLKARELAMRGNLIDAQNILETDFQGLNSESYLTFGDIILDCHKGMVRNLERTLDLETAIHTVTYFKSNIKYTRESFISYPDNVFVTRLSSTANNSVSFTLSVNSPLKNTIYSENETLILDGICPSHSYRNLENKKLNLNEYEDEPEKKGISFRGAIKVKTDGTIAYSQDKIIVTNANAAIIYFTCETSFNGFNKHPFLEGKEYKNACLKTLENAYSKKYDEIKSNHISDYKKYYDRVELNLGDEPKKNLPTDKRLADFTGSHYDPGLYALLFNYGRYLTIAASREGSQAMNLQGIWNNSMTPPWSSNYTVNINTEMNYFPTLMTDMPEMHMPLIEFIKELSVAGEKTATELYGARGFTAHHNVDIWRMTTPAVGRACWSFWPMSSGWLCRHLFEHYEYTLDKAFLKDTAYPIMLKAASFYLDMLIEDANGYLICAPSTSPENLFWSDGNQECAVSQTSTMTMSIIKELFINCQKSAEILGESCDIIEEIKEKYPKLLPFKVGAKGDLLEWYNDEPWCEQSHRHVSHLYALHPARLINQKDTPELVTAAKNTLKFRGDNGTGWSLGWKINFWARLFDGDHAGKLIDMQLRPIDNRYVLNFKSGGGTYPNMFDAHPPFQIDGNFGATSGIAEMLMQSTEDTIYILPALPSSWKKGYIKGLRAKGNIKVDIYWNDGKLTDYKLYGNTDNIKVMYNNTEID